jgi:hypothetical protein
LSGVDQPPACVTPPEPMRTSSISTPASVRPGAADLDRADQGVARVQLAFQAVGIRLVLRRAPAGVEARERDRVSRLDRQDRLEVAREVAVERAPLERDLVQRH